MLVVITAKEEEEIEICEFLENYVKKSNDKITIISVTL